MTNQGEDLLDDLQEFLEHFDYDSNDDLTSYYDSEGSFSDSEDYDWLECTLPSMLSERTQESHLVREIFWSTFKSQNLQPMKRKISKIVIHVL